MEFSYSVPEHSMHFTVSAVLNQIAFEMFCLLGILVGHGIGFFNRNLE